MNKLKVFAAALLPFAASLAIQIIITFWVSFGFGFASVWNGIASSDTKKTPDVYALETLTSPLFFDITLLVTSIVLASFFFVWYRKQKNKPQKIQGKTVFCPRNLLIFLVSGLCVQICISLFLTVLLPLFPTLETQYESLVKTLIGDNLIISLISTILLLPFAEEIIFRELMTKKLLTAFPFWTANILQALMFGIYHMNLIQGVYAFILGLLFGYVAYRMRSVYASVLFHGVINGSAQILKYILPTSLLESILGMLILASITGLIVILLTFLYRFPSRATSAIVDASTSAFVDASTSAFVDASTSPFENASGGAPLTMPETNDPFHTTGIAKKGAEDTPSNE